jgi:hypothetical protein
MKGVPDVLNSITGVVLAYRPKPRTKAAKKRKRLKNKIEEEKKSNGDHGSDARG